MWIKVVFDITIEPLYSALNVLLLLFLLSAALTFILCNKCHYHLCCVHSCLLVLFCCCFFCIYFSNFLAILIEWSIVHITYISSPPVSVSWNIQVTLSQKRCMSTATAAAQPLTGASKIAKTRIWKRRRRDGEKKRRKIVNASVLLTNCLLHTATADIHIHIHETRKKRRKNPTKPQEHRGG